MPVPLKNVLHLKSAITALPDGTIIAADPDLIDTSPLPTLRAVPEEGGAHVVVLDRSTVLMATSAPNTAAQFAGPRASTSSPSTSASSRRWRAA